MSPFRKLENQEIVVVGGTYGVGPAVILAAASRGANVVSCCPPGSEATAEEITSLAHSADIPGQISFLVADVSNEAGVEQFFDAVVDRIPEFYGLINNLPILFPVKGRSLIETSLAHWNKILAAHLSQSFLSSRRVVEELVGGGVGGRIVHIATMPSRDDGTSRVCHLATESALYAFTRSVAKECGRYNISANMVIVRVEQRLLLTNPYLFAQRPGRQVHRSLFSFKSEPFKSISETVLFLASDKASFVSGEVLHVTNGLISE